MTLLLQHTSYIYYLSKNRHNLRGSFFFLSRFNGKINSRHKYSDQSYLVSVVVWLKELRSMFYICKWLQSQMRFYDSLENNAIQIVAK